MPTESRNEVVVAVLAREKRGPTVDEVIESEWDSGLVGHLK